MKSWRNLPPVLLAISRSSSSRSSGLSPTTSSHAQTDDSVRIGLAETG